VRGGAVWVALGVWAMTAGCHRPAAPAPAPVQVTAYTVEPRSVTVAQEYVGQVAAAREVKLLPRVTGYLERQAFTDGARVHRGDLLFVIDPRPFRAALDQARGQLLQAQAALAKARQDVSRFAPLVRDRALPRQNLDDARAAERGAAASVLALTAGMEAARLNLRYTEVRSPEDGRIGRAEVFPGALVSAGQTPLATVSTIDPIEVDFAVSELEYLRLAPELGGEQLKLPLELLLADGSTYPHRGRVDFVDRALGAQTGTFALRARFPNPEELLRPGMFARVRVMQPIPEALLVPSAALVQVLSNTSVVRVGPGDVAESHPVELGPAVGAFRVVKSGLAPGDRVVVTGLPQAQPGVHLVVSAADAQQLEAPETAATGKPPPAASQPAPARRPSSAAQGTGQGSAAGSGGGR